MTHVIGTAWHSALVSDRGAAAGPGLLDGLAFLGEVADELVVRTVRDTHLAWSRRVYAAVGRRTGGVAGVPRVVDHGIAGAVYAGIGVGMRGASLGLGAVATTGRGPRLEDSRAGRFLSRSVIGLVGDRLARERPTLAWAMSLRRDGADVRGRPRVARGGLPVGRTRSRRVPARPVRGRDGLGPAGRPPRDDVPGGAGGRRVDRR